MRRGQTLSGITGRKEMRRRPNKFDVKAQGSTLKQRQKLFGLSQVEESRIPGVAVKCVDIWRNTHCEGSFLDFD